MAKQTKRLARGLESLISREDMGSMLPTEVSGLKPDTETTHPVGSKTVDAVTVRPAALTPNPFQPRSGTTDDNVLRLSESLRRTGMLQPIVARRVGEQLQIVVGERRWRAAIAAKIERVPVLVRQATDEQMLEMALVENIQREDLNPMDRARAYRRFCEAFNLSAEEVGQRVGEDRTTVTNYLRLLDLPGEVMDLVSSGGISAGHARCLLGIERRERQVELARSAAGHQLSVRALEEIARREKSERAKAVDAGDRSKERTPHIVDLEQRFQAAIGANVKIRPSRHKDRGRIIIEYNSLDDFDRVAAALGVVLE